MRDYSFGDFLYELRSRKGLTQLQLGTFVGVSDKAVSKWENGISKPQSSILYKISEVLGVSVDELLACKYRSSENKDDKAIFAIKKQLWNKAFDALCKRYGNPAPIEITNRYLTERAEMQNTDSIVYLNVLSVLSTEAKKRHEHIMVKGGMGSSLVSYLLGATEINPLKPHYYCPYCHTVIFDKNTADGWDLPPKKCSCGKLMIADGHDIPFESYRFSENNGPFALVSVSCDFFSTAIQLVEEHFMCHKLTKKVVEKNRVFNCKISSGYATGTISIHATEEYTKFHMLAQTTSTSFDRITFHSNEVLQEFQKVNTDGILEFQTKHMKNMLHTSRVNSFHDLIQIFGLFVRSGTWSDKARTQIDRECPVDKSIAYRDDVFRLIHCKLMEKGLTGSGFAYTVMKDTYRGFYAKNGISNDTIMQLKSIEIDDCFVDSIGKIKTLMHKAHGVSCVQLAATLMWYKINYPKEFYEIMQ